MVAAPQPKVCRSSIRLLSVVDTCHPAGMEMPIPSDGHRKLEKIAGQWEGEETMHPSPWDLQGGKATGHIRSRVALSGFALINDYEQERDGKVPSPVTAFSHSIPRKIFTA